MTEPAAGGKKKNGVLGFSIAFVFPSRSNTAFLFAVTFRLSRFLLPVLRLSVLREAGPNTRHILCALKISKYIYIYFFIYNNNECIFGIYIYTCLHIECSYHVLHISCIHMCCTSTCMVVVDGTCCHVVASASPAWWRCTLCSLHLRGVVILSRCHLRGGTVALHHLRGDVMHVARVTCVVSRLQVLHLRGVALSMLAPCVREKIELFGSSCVLLPFAWVSPAWCHGCKCFTCVVLHYRCSLLLSAKELSCSAAAACCCHLHGCHLRGVTLASASPAWCCTIDARCF